MRRTRVAKFVSSFSLLVLAVGGWANIRYADLLRDLEAASTPKDAAEVIRQVRRDDRLDPVVNQPSARRLVAKPTEKDKTELTRIVRRIVALESERKPSTFSANAQARRIKHSGSYLDPAEERRSNWIAKAARNVAELMNRIPQPDRTTQGARPNMGGLGDIIANAMYALLFLAVAGGLIFAARQIRLAKMRKSRLGSSNGVMEIDEPDRTADEWILNADALAAQGKYREAVRSLYLACLVKLDEAELVKLIRSETNWEHYRRLMDNPRRPADFEFLGATQRFDQIWYGNWVRGIEDLQFFKEVYARVCTLKP